MSEPTQRHPECPDVHVGICRKCRRLYERDRKNAEQMPSALAPIAAAAEIVANAIADTGLDASVEEQDAVAAAVEEQVRPLTPAEKNRERVRRWRKKVLSDPERAELLRKADRLRKRRKRKE